jgi:hypothetical protein
MASFVATPLIDPAAQGRGNNFSDYIDRKQFAPIHYSSKPVHFDFQNAKPFHRITNSSIKEMDAVFGGAHASSVAPRKPLAYPSPLGDPHSMPRTHLDKPFGFLTQAFPKFDRSWQTPYLPEAHANKLVGKTKEQIQQRVKLSHARDPDNGGEARKQETTETADWAVELMGEIGVHNAAHKKFEKRGHEASALDHYDGADSKRKENLKEDVAEFEDIRSEIRQDKTEKRVKRAADAKRSAATRAIPVTPASSILAAPVAPTTPSFTTPDPTGNKKQRRARHNEEMQRMAGGGNSASAAEGPSTPPFGTPATSKKSSIADERLFVFLDTPQAQKMMDEIQKAGKQVEAVDRKIEKEHDTGKSTVHQGKREELEEKIREAKAKLSAKQEEIALIDKYEPIRDEEWSLIQKIQKQVEQGGNVTAQFVIEVNAEMSKLGYPKVSGKIHKPDSLHKAVVSSMKQFKLATIAREWLSSSERKQHESYRKSPAKKATPRHDADGDPDDRALEVDDVDIKINRETHGKVLKERFGEFL